MKKTLSILAATLSILACNNAQKSASTEQQSVDSVSAANAKTSPIDKKFSIEDIPFSSAELGDFPFFTTPEGAKYINNVKPKAFDFIVFVTPTDIFEVEGKTYRSWVQQDRDSKQELTGRYLFKSYDDAIRAVGGVKVFEGSLNGERLEKYNKLCTYGGADGSFIPNDSEIVTYIIRRKEGNIYIALEKKDSPSTSIQIVQEKPFEQTIKKITADDIVKDLADKGKSILYINFDLDKASVKPDGAEVVDQIAAALRKEGQLKIAIEGHTDNSGDEAHNKKLSSDRATAVLNALAKNGIDKSRLTAAGFGADRPLVANDSEENKAKNRRVELIKVK